MIKKLDFMDRLMGELAGTTPVVTGRQLLDPLPRIYKTLRDHYEEKRKHYGIGRTPSYDTDLKKLFSDGPTHAKNPSAAEFLRRTRKEIRRRVAEWTGEYQYTIDQVLEGMIERCQASKLHLTQHKEQAKLDFAILLTVQTMNMLSSNAHESSLRLVPAGRMLESTVRLIASCSRSNRSKKKSVPVKARMSLSE